MNKLCIATGWHSNSERMKRNATDPRMYQKNYLSEIREPAIQRYFNREEYAGFVHVSVQANEVWPTLPPGTVCVIGQYGPFYHMWDFHVSVMMAAEYAMCYKMDLVYIEQDCLVYGLDKAVAWARGRKHVYGFGEYSYANGWAENSLMYVSNEFLPEFIHRINFNRLHELGKQFPETIWHEVFKDVAEYWPFGWGRKRPVNITSINTASWYMQQLQPHELNFILEKIHNE